MLESSFYMQILVSRRTTYYHIVILPNLEKKWRSVQQIGRRLFMPFAHIHFYECLCAFIRFSIFLYAHSSQVRFLSIATASRCNINCLINVNTAVWPMQWCHVADFEIMTSLLARVSLIRAKSTCLLIRVHLISFGVWLYQTISDSNWKTSPNTPVTVFER